MRTHAALSHPGFTMIEMLMVIVLIGALLAISLPYFRSSTAKSSVRGAADVIASLHSLARTAAVQRGRTARLVVPTGGNKALVIALKATGSGVDTVGSVADLAQMFGVTVTTTRDTVTFSPRGIGSDLTATTIIVTKGSFADTITVAAGGRLTK